jgi:hypothetical protein
VSVTIRGASLRVLVLAAVAALLAAACGGAGELGARALSQRSEAVGSLAAEGALLAGDAAAGRTTGTFRREHAAALAKTAAATERDLAAATTPAALDPERRRLAALAARVQAALARIGGASGAEQQVLRRELERAAGESERIGEELA